MDQPQLSPEPSIFTYALAGYLIASVLGVIAVTVLSVRAGDYDEPTAFQLLAAAGAGGAMLGFDVAARKRRAFGGGVAEEWKRFWGSPAFYGLAAMVLSGSLMWTVIGTFVAIAVMGSPAPK